MKSLLSIFMIFVTLCVFSQASSNHNSWNGGTTNAGNSSNSKEGFTYGAGLGFCFASGKNALFYNGEPDRPYNVQEILNNQTYLSAFNQILYPSNVVNIIYSTTGKYQPTMGVNGYAGYVFKNNTAIIFQIQYTRFRTTNEFTVYLDQPLTTTLNSDNITYGSITSSESRVDFELGYKIPFATTKTYMPYVILSGNLNSVAVKSEQMQMTTVNGTFGPVSLINVPFDPNYIPTVQGGIGTGVSATLGVDIPSKKKRVYSLGLHGSMKKIHLLQNAGLTPHADIFVSVMF